MTTVRQLVNNLGTSEKLIAGNPTMTYMRDVYRGNAQCTNQVITMQFPKNIYYGSDVTIDLYQEGDIIDAVWLRLVFPPGLTATVCDSFGTYVLNWVQLECGNQTIERIHGEYIEMFNDLNVHQGKQAALTQLVGKNTTTPLTTYTVKLPFSAFKYGFPVCALKENARIRFNIRNFSECGTGVTANPLFNATLLVDYIFLQEKERDFFVKNPLTYLLGQNQLFQTQFTPKLSNYVARPFTLPQVALGTATSFTFNTNPYTISFINLSFTIVFVTAAAPTGAPTILLNTVSQSVTSATVGTVTTVQVTVAVANINIGSLNTLAYTWSGSGTSVTSATVTSTTGSYTGGGSLAYNTFFTKFRNPCKELFFVLQRTNAQPYDYTLTSANDILSSLRIKLNEKEYLKAETGTPMFHRIIKGLDRHTRIPDRRFYMYSFSIDPENNQPSGSLNFGMVQRQQFDFSVNYTTSPLNLRMYMRTYNLMQIQDGKLAMLYFGPTDITL